MAESILQPLGAGILAAPKPGAFAQACRDAPDNLLYFLLNVGDGDCQLVVSSVSFAQLRGDPVAGGGVLATDRLRHHSDGW